MIPTKIISAATTFGILASFMAASVPLSEPAMALGVMAPSVHVRVQPRVRSINRVLGGTRKPAARVKEVRPAQSRHESRSPKAAAKPAPVAKKPVAVAKPLKPQDFSGKMTAHEIAPGVVHKFFRGSLAINLLDIDMEKSPVRVQTSLASESFSKLKDVAEHARQTNAIAAINANYFKRDGVPLGTIIINGEWVSGPLYDRVSMGITKDGSVKIDRVSFGGTLTSNNEDLPTAWVNNINQPRRSGCHIYAYTRRWGTEVTLPYDGCLVAVDAHGTVVDKGLDKLAIPYGGYVLSDAKTAPLSKLEKGDTVNIAWKTTPSWDDVDEAVSGGPMLIKDGNLFVDLKDEKFRNGWTGSQIKARTVAGVTADKHLLLATIEGPHTLWDVAKFMHKMGAVDAMNLDGGGSTTMVVDGKTVTRNANASQRRVAASLILLDTRKPTSAEKAPATISEAPPAPDTAADASLDVGSASDQVAGMSTVPAQPVDVNPAAISQDSDSSKKHEKKHKHLFGLFGGH